MDEILFELREPSASRIAERDLHIRADGKDRVPGFSAPGRSG
jgi:hypothetical protein